MEIIKKALCLSLVIIIALLGTLQAQNPLAKGLMTAAGGVSWQTDYYDGADGGSTLSLTPNVGYFVTDNIQAIVGLNWSRFTFPDDWGIDPFSLTALVLGGRYYMPLGFGPVYAGALFNYFKWSDDDEATNSLDIQAGYLKFFNDNLALDIGFNYNMGLGDNKSSSFMLGAAAVVFFTAPF
ncbi:MAG: hypothetical protein IIC41_06160 [Candidatus Marinimicrobia bacterium]|nr:hypothetical protein [Candidatus Neomarinimicrobiota bacterium]